MIIKNIIKFNIIYFISKKKNFIKILLLFNIIFFYKLNFYIKKNIGFLKFNNFFFYLKKNKFLKKIKINLNIYKLDLLFRFSKISYLLIYSFKKYIIMGKNKKNLKYFLNKFSFKKLFLKLTPVAGISILQKNLLKKLSQLTVGSFEYLPLNYTYSGYYSPLLIRRKKRQFFSKITEFLFIKKYRFIYNKININFSRFKSVNYFPGRTPNINLKILFFFTNKKKINVFKNNYSLKQYKIFKANNKNINFFKINWLISSKKGFNKKTKIPFSNLRSKKKYILKFYRLAFNDLFQTKYKSHTLTHIFNKIHSNIGLTGIKHLKNELKLQFFLIRINFALNLNDSQFLIENGYIFINGKTCYNLNFLLKNYDRVQLLNFYDEYIQHRFIISNNVTKKARMWFALKKYYLTISKPYKTQPNLRKKWLIKVLWQLTDIPKYVEVDFQIFTAIILYKPKFGSDIFPFLLTYYNYKCIKMLNWKYNY